MTKSKKLGLSLSVVMLGTAGDGRWRAVLAPRGERLRGDR